MKGRRDNNHHAVKFNFIKERVPKLIT